MRLQNRDRPNARLSNYCNLTLPEKSNRVQVNRALPEKSNRVQVNRAVNYWDERSHQNISEDSTASNRG